MPSALSPVSVIQVNNVLVYESLYAEFSYLQLQRFRRKISFVYNHDHCVGNL